MINSNQYNIHAADWRKQLGINNRRTRVVIISFILIYLILGLLVDVYINLPSLNNIQAIPNNENGLVYLIQQLLTFKIFPYATVIMGVVAAISLFVTYSFYDKIMLLGTEYSEVTRDNATDPRTQQ